MSVQTIDELAQHGQDLEKEVRLPYVLKDKVLFSPGIWNNNLYAENEVKDAFNRTNWASKEIRGLFLDHLDQSVPDWVGLVENPRQEKDGTVKGDLHLVDKTVAMKLHYGAKFGISPKVQGLEDKGQMRAFSFENWSIVITPACKMTYINNKEGNIMDAENALEELAMPESSDAGNPSKSEVPEEQPMAEAPKEQTLAEFIESLSETELSEWTSFLSEKRKSGVSLSDISTAFKAKRSMKESYAKMSETELNEVISLCSELLKCKAPKKEESPASAKMEEKFDATKLKEEIMKEVAKELSKKATVKEEVVVERATVKTQELSANETVAAPAYKNSAEGLMHWIKNGGSGVFNL